MPTMNADDADDVSRLWKLPGHRRETEVAVWEITPRERAGPRDAWTVSRRRWKCPSKLAPGTSKLAMHVSYVSAYRADPGRTPWPARVPLDPLYAKRTNSPLSNRPTGRRPRIRGSVSPDGSGGFQHR